MIDVQSLVIAGVNPLKAAQFAAPLREACYHNAIRTPKRIAAFVSQAINESAGFTHLEENLHYTTPDRILAVFPSRVKTDEQARALAGKPEKLANCVYANRLGNGSELSGEGWAYRGRGIFQLTGKTNYDLAGVAIGQPLLAFPDRAWDPENASNIAAWFWVEHGCNELADMGDIAGITRKINGPAMLGLKERGELYIKALAAFA